MRAKPEAVAITDGAAAAAVAISARGEITSDELITPHLLISMSTYVPDCLLPACFPLPSRHLSVAHPVAISTHRRPPLNPSLMNSAVYISGWWRHCDVIGTIPLRLSQNNKTQTNDCGVIAATPCHVISRHYDRRLYQSLPVVADCRSERTQRVKKYILGYRLLQKSKVVECTILKFRATKITVLAPSKSHRFMHDE